MLVTARHVWLAEFSPTSGGGLVKGLNTESLGQTCVCHFLASAARETFISLYGTFPKYVTASLSFLNIFLGATLMI